MSPIGLPPSRPSFQLSELGRADWVVGRAGMLYRDLIPDRQGGRFIASHIRIPEGGPVPDWVHYHRVRFQMIYCYRGWVRVVYEDQGAPFVLREGDCVLQPPEIRHRVLECSAGLEVVEVTCPADHETCADRELELPTDRLAPERVFGGQRFVRHRAEEAVWGPGPIDGFDQRDLGLAAATNGLVEARVVRCVAADEWSETHQDELRFSFVLGGSATMRCRGYPETRLSAGDAVVIPPDARYALDGCSPGLSLLRVRSPA